ncbi:MAG: methyltransferase domain-containing protein [Candidatus Moranbacteria bacterium]|nr:methyltransferase domain-containing protein [Candidatus Moranbacteria bacterium]
MAKEKYFLDRPETRHYEIQGAEMDLEVNEKVFPPPIGSSILSRNIRVEPGESVIDIGTGTGFLAILASKLGGKAYGTDISENAIELARKNSELNGAKAEFAVGGYFGSFNLKFDVIIANLSQTVLPDEFRKEAGLELSNTVYGGKNGNDVLVEFLSIAPEFMHVKTRMYVNVYSVSDYEETFRRILETYDARMLEIGVEPVKEFVEDNIEMYLDLNKQGKITIFHDDRIGRWCASQFALELTLK